ncbi:spore germination protein GerW family protein [Nonomuraea sp. NPDC049152]|uniref:spore germination protein GerW family protein n=1 Tax=Nonomuraea sp. NPDC049152 TaxID=3154350 RepID=UPI0033C92339
MDIMTLIEKTKDGAGVQRVFGEPVTQGDVTVIPVARIAQGGGGGGGKQEGERPSQGSGGGYGLGATPAGVFVIKNGEVKWQPAVDVNRIVIGGQIVAVVLLLTIRSIVKRWRKGRR